MQSRVTDTAKRAGHSQRMGHQLGQSIKNQLRNITGKTRLVSCWELNN